MFEKDAEEYLKKDGTKAEQIFNILNEISPLKITSKQVPFILAMIKQTFQDGAEFGYNKANEWHYVKDEDLPNTAFGRANVTIAYINAYENPCKMDCCFDGTNFIYWDDRKPIGWKKADIFGKIYAWKYPEKLPELPKESK
jgi:hypothetical protein